MAEHLRLEQPVWDEMKWKEVEVESGMVVQQEWDVPVWMEAETASFVGDAGCVTRLE